MSESKYLVYCHLRNDTNEIFYVGKGTLKRVKDRSNRNKYWHNIVNKVGYSVQVIAANIFENEALSFEVLMIKKLLEQGVRLCNMTKGGEGISGYKHSKEVKELLSILNKGKPSHNKGKPMSDVQKELLRKINTGRKHTDEHKRNAANARRGRKVSEDTKKKLSLANLGRRHTEESLLKMRQPVFCITNNTIYCSVSEAAKQLSLSTSNISRCCKGVFKQTGGFVFVYIDEQGITA